MRKFTLNIFTLSLGLAVMPMVEAAPTAQQQLLEQVRLGEATHREDLVQQSLYRLELIDPNNPDVVAARFRSLLRQGDIDGAQKQLDRLSQLAPSSNAYKSSRTTMLLSTPDGRQALQQARLQATTGHAEEAVASYNKLFNGAPPEGDIAVEYWSTVAKIPARRGEAINQLKRINAIRRAIRAYKTIWRYCCLVAIAVTKVLPSWNRWRNQTPGAKGPLKSGTGRLKTCPSAMPVCRR